MKKLIADLGITPMAAIGLVGCIYCESRGTPSAKNPAGSATGICQWLSNRQNAMKRQFPNFPAAFINWSLDQQIKGLEWELQTLYKGMYNNYIKNATTIAQSVYYAIAGFENGGGSKPNSVGVMKKTYPGGGHNPSYEVMLKEREDAAIGIYNAYSGGNAGADVIGDRNGDFSGDAGGGDAGGGNNGGGYYGGGYMPRNPWQGASANGPNANYATENSALAGAKLNTTKFASHVVKGAENANGQHTRIYSNGNIKVVVDELSMPIDERTARKKDTSTANTSTSTTNTKKKTTNNRKNV